MEAGKARKTRPFQEPGFRGSWSGYERDVFFHNPGGSRFIECGYSMGVDFADDGRAVAPLDYDGDGDLDLAMLSLQGLRLLENTAPARHFARVRLEAARGDAHAIGSVVTLEAGGAKQQDYVKATTGFATQVPFDLHFGLGDSARIDRITVRWADGSPEETFTNLPADRLLKIRQGAGTAAESVLPRWPEETRPRSLAALDLKATAERIEGGRAALLDPRASRGPVILNFWSPTCAPCRTELPALEALRAKGAAQVVGVCVERGKPDLVKAAIAEFKLGYPQFLADAPLMASFFGHDGVAPMPATFVFDGEGRLRRAYYRAVEEAELSSLLATFGAGKFHADHLSVATHHMARREYEAAERELRKALEFDPDYALAHFHLGIMRGLQNRHAEAVDALQRSIGLDPEYTNARQQLAVAYKALRRYREAEAAARAALQIDPSYADAHLVLGQVLAEAGRREEGLAAMEEAVRLAPQHANGFSDLGKLLRAMGRPADAERALRRALELDPQHVEAKAILARMRR